MQPEATESTALNPDTCYHCFCKQTTDDLVCCKCGLTLSQFHLKQWKSAQRMVKK